MECKTSKNIIHDLISKKYSLIISPLDISVEHEQIVKKTLKKEKIGIVAHKDLISDKHKIDVMMNNSNMLHTTSSLEHKVMRSLIKKMISSGINIKTVATNEIGLLYMLKDKAGYSIISECFFKKNKDIMKDLVFIKEPFNLSLTRKAYFLKDNIHFFDLNLFNND